VTSVSYEWTKRRPTTDAIIVHAVTRAETAHDLDILHRRSGYYCCGFHYSIDASGPVNTRHPETIGHHLEGWDKHSIAVALVGWDGKTPLPEDLAAHADQLLADLYSSHSVTAVAAPTLLGIEGYGPLQDFVREANARRPVS